MKFTIFLLILISNVYSSSYMFLPQEYNTTIELESKISVKCINRLVLHTVEYGVHFGPVEY